MLVIAISAGIIRHMYVCMQYCIFLGMLVLVVILLKSDAFVLVMCYVHLYRRRSENALIFNVDKFDHYFVRKEHTIFLFCLALLVSVKSFICIIFFMHSLLTENNPKERQAIVILSIIPAINLDKQKIQNEYVYE